MIGSVCGLLGRCDPAVADEFREQLGMVDHLVAAAEVRVLVRDRVEAVRAAGDDLGYPGLVERLDVLLGERLEHVLVADPAGGVAGAALARSEDREVEARVLQQLRGRLGGLASALVERGRASHPVQVLGGGVAGLEDLDPQVRRPVGALGLGLAPGVRRALDVAEHLLGLGGEARLDHHQMTAQVDDVIDVLDRDRARLHAGAAGHAVPDHVGRDRLVVRVAFRRPGRAPGRAAP